MIIKNQLVRHDDRTPTQIRPISCVWNTYSYAPGAVIIEWGNTKVLCAVTMQQGVPPFLRGKGSGWLAAEYALLPTATQTRSMRDSAACKRNGRAVEISRLIGRVLRTVIDLNAIGERTIYIDCDVLQADGGTRVAAITGTSLALQRAQEQWLAEGLIERPFLKDIVVALAVGLYKGSIILDPDYQEDTDIDADFNIVMTASGKIIEMQGGAEKDPLTWQQFDQVREMALIGMEQITRILGIDETFKNLPVKAAQKVKANFVEKDDQKNKQRSSIFSLGLRAKEKAN